MYLEHVDTIESDIFNDPPVYRIYIQKDVDIHDKMWYWNDLYVARVNNDNTEEYIYRSFDGSQSNKAEVKKGYENEIMEFIDEYDIPCFAQIEIVDEIKYKTLDKKPYLFDEETKTYRKRFI